MQTRPRDACDLCGESTFVMHDPSSLDEKVLGLIEFDPSEQDRLPVRQRHRETNWVICASRDAIKQRGRMAKGISS